MSSVTAERLQTLLAAGCQRDSWRDDLEAGTADLTGAAGVIATVAGLAGIQLLLRAAGVVAGDEIILPVTAPVFWADAIRSVSGVPVLVDVDRDSLTTDLSATALKLSSRTKAIVVVSNAGETMDLAERLALASTHGSLLIEDALGASPVTYHDGAARPLLAESHVRCFHFSGPESDWLNDGLLIASGSRGLTERMRQLLDDHGQPVDAPAEAEPSIEVMRPLSLLRRISALSAAWQLAVMSTAQADWQRRRQIAMSYSAAFSSARELELPHETPDQRHSWCHYRLRLNPHGQSVTRDELARNLQRRGLAVRVTGMPLHFLPRFRPEGESWAAAFPVARDEFLRHLSLPIHAQMSDSAVDTVIQAVLDELAACRFR